MKILPRKTKHVSSSKNTDSIMYSVTKTGRKDVWDCNLYIPEVELLINITSSERVNIELILVDKRVLKLSFGVNGDFNVRKSRGGRRIVTFPWSDELPLVRPARKCTVLNPEDGFNQLTIELPKPDPDVVENKTLPAKDLTPNKTVDPYIKSCPFCGAGKLMYKSLEDA